MIFKFINGLKDRNGENKKKKAEGQDLIRNVFFFITLQKNSFLLELKVQERIERLRGHDHQGKSKK